MRTTIPTRPSINTNGCMSGNSLSSSRTVTQLLNSPYRQLRRNPLTKSFRCTTLNHCGVSRPDQIDGPDSALDVQPDCGPGLAVEIVHVFAIALLQIPRADSADAAFRIGHNPNALRQVYSNFSHSSLDAH